MSIFKHSSKLSFFISILIISIFVFTLAHHYQKLTHIFSVTETLYQEWLDKQNTTNPLILISLAFVGGLLTSISPCILSLLPVNLSYIGTLQIISRRDAFIKAGLFTLGVTTIFSLFGIFASFASYIILAFRGQTNILVGIFILIMGLCFAGIINLPLPKNHISIPLNNPYGVGLTFALVSSPCGSPVLFSILIASANTGSQLISTLTMIGYALGYSAVIFLASLFTGILKQSRLFLKKSQWVIRCGCVGLICAGGYYLYIGIISFL
jgi:cytochrome c-type biogenesis protein